MIVDQFTKWIECFPLPHQTAEEVAKVFVDGFISRFGCPLQVHTDQGRQFEGHLFQAVCKLLEITKTRTTPYHPCSNGQVERYNRTLLQMIRCFLRNDQTRWDENLPILSGAIRSMKNRQTGFSPNMMMFGREVIKPIDIMMGNTENHQRKNTPVAYVQTLRSNLGLVHDVARESLQTAQMRQKKDYDVTVNQRCYEVGDLVYLVNSATKIGQNKKLKPVWLGPFLVIKRISAVLYRIRGQKGVQVVHHDRIKCCRDRVVPFWLRRMRHSLLDLDSTLDYEDDSEENDLGEADAVVSSQVEGFPLQDGFGVYSDGDDAVDMGEGRLTPEVMTTRHGRAVVIPHYLKDYV
jgi:hypothetical protein